MESLDRRAPKTTLSAMPATARPHTTPNNVQPHPPRSTPNVNGVYVPAINRKIAPWSTTLMTRLTRVCGQAWYSVEVRYSTTIVLAKIVPPTTPAGSPRPAAATAKIGIAATAPRNPNP